MPFSSSLRGQTSESVSSAVDERCCSAFAAGIGDWNSCYWDDEGAGIVAHPVFPASLEWPAYLGVREISGGSSLDDGEFAKVVHASQDLHIKRPVKPGDKLLTRAKVMGYLESRHGTVEWLRVDTLNGDEQELVCTSYQSFVGIGVQLNGSTGLIQDPPAVPQGESAETVLSSWRVELSPWAPHVYAECSRIHNPIHTSQSVALKAGLPGPIMHGSAILAHAVTKLVDGRLEGLAGRVRRLGCRFSAMVVPPDDIEIRLLAESDDVLFFEVFRRDGTCVLKSGYVVFD